MHLFKPAALAAVIFAATTAQAQLQGGVAAGSYGEVTYEEIHDIELKFYSRMVSRPYEVLVRGTPFRRMVACQLYDQNGTPLSATMTPSGNGETRLFFEDKAPNATARCFFANVERKIRPSTP